MNLSLAARLAMLLTALSLVAYGLSGYLNALFGLGTRGFFSEPWKLIAISIGVSVIAGFAQPTLRGIRKGDKVFAFVQRNARQGEQNFFFTDMLPATALEDGKVGSKIKISLPDGARGEGIVLGYQGIFTPPTIRIVETERLEF